MEEKANIAAEGKEEVFSREDYKRIVENLLFITDRPLSAAKLSQVAQINNIQLTKDIVNALAQEYAQSGRAIQIVELGGGFQMSTKPEYGRWVRALFNEKSSDKLSPAALETLAIIAYKQPVTRADIEAIRGVDIVGPLEKIMERGLVRVVGRKDAPGKPMVYGTTDEFLRVFGLNHISQLPELKTFESKGPREIQSDLPFGPSLPQVKEAILPLEEEADIYTRNTPEGSDAVQGFGGFADTEPQDITEPKDNLPEHPQEQNAEAQDSGDSSSDNAESVVNAAQSETDLDIASEDQTDSAPGSLISGQPSQGVEEKEEDVMPEEGFKQESGLEEDMLKEGFDELK